MHVGGRVGLDLLHKPLEGLCILLKQDDIVSAALYASVLVDTGEFPIDKILVG